MGSIPVRVIKKLLNLRIEELFLCKPNEESKEHGPPAGGKKESGGLFFSVRVPRVRNVYRGCCCLDANAQGRFLLDPYGNRNNDDRYQWQKQGVIVGAVASKTRVPSKA